MRFIEYQLTSDALCMGERIKAGLLRPCAKTIRYSQITGALRRKFDYEDIHAVGYLYGDSSHNVLEYLVYSPRDRARELSKVPLQVEFLSNVLGKIFVLENKVSQLFPEQFEIQMGGLLSKGFGRCTLKKNMVRDGSEMIGGKETFQYVLNIRIPEKCASTFNVRVIRPVYGYLFEATSITKGVWVRSLFEGTVASAPEYFLKKVR